ncbi:hypothetical protein GCM10027200_35330 [Lentzea nigeriaca]
MGTMGAGSTDFNGDGFADMSILYDYGGGEAGLFVLPGKPVIDDGVTRSPYMVWSVPRGNFWPSAMKITAGDFNGDGRSDVLALYDYGGGEAGLFIYPGTSAQGSTAAEPYLVWSAPRGNFWPSVMKITAGDFNGDGLSDLLALYDYGRGEAGLFVFPGTTGRYQGATSPYLVWHAPPGNFEVSRATPAAGDFNGDGRADLVVMYDYGNNEYALWVMQGTTSRQPDSVNPYWCWHSAGWTSFPRYQLNTGDINGDGRSDLVVAVDNATWFLSGTAGSGDNATWPGLYLTDGISLNDKKITVGDFNGNGAADVITLVDKGNGVAEAWVTPGGVPAPSRYKQRVWLSGSGQFWPSVTKVA